MPAVRFPVEPAMTMETVLRLPAVRRGAPELLAGAERLATPVRWAHSCEARHIAGLLEGGELLLTTGMGLRAAAADQRAFVGELVEHGVAGLVLELGRVFRTPPEALVAEARRLRLPLVVLRAEVRFVEITEQLHTALLGRRTVAEARVAELVEGLQTALLDGAGVEPLLRTLATAVGNPVVLERVSGEIVFHAADRSAADDLLTHLRLLEEEAAQDRIAAAPVARPGGGVWGRLLVFAHERDVDAATRLAVTRTAPLIALALRRAGETAQLRSRERGNFLDDLLTGAIRGPDAAARAASLGAPAAAASSPAPALLPVAAAWRSGAADEERAEIGPRARRALRGRGVAGLLGIRPAHDDVLLVLALPAGTTRAAGADAAARALHGDGDGRHLTVAAGPLVDGWDGVAEALRAAVDAAHTMREAAPVAWHDADRADVDRLLRGLREDPQVAAFARRRLSPVREHDRAGRAPLLPTLRALSDSHWHKADAARALGIRRQSLYARIGRLQRLLDADLDDPGVRLGLDLAVRADAA